MASPFANSPRYVENGQGAVMPNSVTFATITRIPGNFRQEIIHSECETSFGISKLMDGIVVWADSESMRAIVWCKDNGPLAWLSGWPAVRFSVTFPVVGDLLYVDVVEGGDMRRVTRAFMKAPGHDPGVVRRLHEAAGRGALSSELPDELQKKT